MIANANRDADARPEPFSPEEFMPQFEAAEPKVQSTEEQIQMVEMLNALFGGEDLRGQ